MIWFWERITINIYLGFHPCKFRRENISRKYPCFNKTKDCKIYMQYKNVGKSAANIYIQFENKGKSQWVVETVASFLGVINETLWMQAYKSWKNIPEVVHVCRNTHLTWHSMEGSTPASFLKVTFIWSKRCFVRHKMK